MKKKEIAVELFRHLCEHNWHGYDQRRRWGDGEGVCNVTLNGVTYKLEQGDRDCSSAIISAFEAAGISCGGATYTGNMRPCMVATGNFQWRNMSFIAQSGDVYLNERDHTAMCMSAVPDILGEFSIAENGTIYAGRTGDQTGKESWIHSYYNYPWDGILQCINNEDAKGHETARTYIVVDDDTLFEIGAKYHVSVADLVKANNISNPNLIYVGQQLIIP